MKVVAKPIEVIAWFKTDGVPKPLRFRINDNDSKIVIKVDRIVQTDTEKLAGNQMIVFRCQSLINDVTKVYELKYELKTCKWILYKM